MVSGHPSTQVTIEGSEKESWSMGLVMEETKEPSHRLDLKKMRSKKVCLLWEGGQRVGITNVAPFSGITRAQSSIGDGIRYLGGFQCPLTHGNRIISVPLRT